MESNHAVVQCGARLPNTTHTCITLSHITLTLTHTHTHTNTHTHQHTHITLTHTNTHTSHSHHTHTQTKWEQATDKKIERNTVQRRMEGLLRKQQYSLEERREKCVTIVTFLLLFLCTKY